MVPRAKTTGHQILMGENGRYHHGDLPNTLLNAAMELLASDGIEALSLRGVARKAGVSQAAPYHHYRDRQALLGAVAEQAHRELGIALQAAIDAGNNDQDSLRLMAVAFVMYAYDNPQLFRLMYCQEVVNYHTPSLDAMILGNYRTLYRVVAAQLGIQLDLEDQRMRRAALGAWSMAHGLATLLVDGRIGHPREDREQLVQFVLEVVSLIDITRVMDGVEPLPLQGGQFSIGVVARAVSPKP